MARRGFTLIEALVALALALIVMGMAYQLFRFAVVSTGATITPQASLQIASRKAMLDFIKEIQECIEVARPLPGSTMSYFVARDKINRVMTAYLVRNAADSARAQRDLYDLYLFR